MSLVKVYPNHFLSFLLSRYHRIYIKFTLIFTQEREGNGYKMVLNWWINSLNEVDADQHRIKMVSNILVNTLQCFSLKA